jgi:hypothetical protein
MLRGGRLVSSSRFAIAMLGSIMKPGLVGEKADVLVQMSVEAQKDG